LSSHTAAYPHIAHLIEQSELRRPLGLDVPDFFNVPELAVLLEHDLDSSSRIAGHWPNPSYQLPPMRSPNRSGAFWAAASTTPRIVFVDCMSITSPGGVSGDPTGCARTLSDEAAQFVKRFDRPTPSRVIPCDAVVCMRIEDACRGWDHREPLNDS
jgi:hypothetical protein